MTANQGCHSNSAILTASPQIISSAKKSFPYTCDICNRVFKEASHFSKHKRGALCHKIAQKMTKKNKRNKDLKCKESLEKKSVPVAAVYKPYQCNLCGAKFFDRVNVELHLERTHQSQQPLWTEVTKAGGFACSECDLWFADKPQLKQHQQQQHSPSQNQPHVNFQHSGLTQQPVLHHQYFPQPLPHMAPSFSPNPHHPYPQLPPPVPPVLQAQPLYQVSQQLPVFSNPQSHPSSLLLAPPPHHTINTVPPLPQSMGTGTFHNFPCNNDNTALQNSSSSTGTTTKQPKSAKVDRSISSSRWNVCGDCGHKFVDPMNVELHLQRKHPDSSITETVALSTGVTVYMTNNSNKNTYILSHESAQEKLTAKSCECVMCGFKTDSLSGFSIHLKRIHNKRLENYEHLEELSDTKKIKQQKTSAKNSVSLSAKETEAAYKCDTCDRSFTSKAELVRHRVKDKNILCGVCGYSSCSNGQVSIHLYASHKVGDISNQELFNSKMNDFCEQVNGLSPASNVSSNQCDDIIDENQSLLSKDVSTDKDVSPSRLYCCMCNFYAGSGVSLAQHLESHGSVHVQCGKCGESSSSFIELNNHINISHNDEFVRVTLTLKDANTPSVYMFLITPKNSNMQSFAQVEKNNPPISSDNKIHCSDMMAVYACSDCGACLTGQYQLEAHLLLHQNPEGSSCAENSLNINVSYQNSSSSSYQSPLSHTQNTLQFRCEECGFWRENSESVIRHIQTIHMSGKMVHSQRQSSGQIIGQTIHVFTPLSAMVSS